MDNFHNKKEPVVQNKNTLKYPSRTIDPPITLVDMAKEIEKAESQIKLNISGKLDLIYNQIKKLQEEAKKIIDAAYNDMELHKVECSFIKSPGQVIYLYEKNNKKLYFSRLSPDDWEEKPLNKFIGAYKLNIDQSFEKV